MQYKMLLIIIFTLSACETNNSASNAVTLSNTNNMLAGKSPGQTPSRNTLPSSTSGECVLNTEQQDLLDAHNAARAVGRQCGATFYPATTPLQWHCTLARIAQAHNIDMAENDFYAHVGSDDLQSKDRATNAGYEWQATAENIHVEQADVDAAMQGWVNSEGHCANIMGSQYQELGADIHRTTDAQYSSYWTTNFGTEF